MRTSIILLSGLLSACASMPSPGNNSGLEVKLESVKNHGEGIDVTLAVNNTTGDTLRLSNEGPASVWLDSGGRIDGLVMQPVNIAPGERKKARLQFEFINAPRIYKKGLIELVPSKVFRSCTAADADPTVVQEKRDDGRETASELQPDTCNRNLKESIRIAF